MPKSRSRSPSRAERYDRDLRPPLSRRCRVNRAAQVEQEVALIDAGTPIKEDSKQDADETVPGFAEATGMAAENADGDKIDLDGTPVG